MPSERIWSAPFALAFTAHFLAGLSLHALIHLPGLLKSWGAGPTLVGVVISTMAVSAIVVRPWVGWWMDERGRRSVIIAGCILHALSCFAYLGLDGIGVAVFVVRIVQGIADAMIFSAFFTVAADLVPAKRRTEGIAIFGVSGMLPISLGPLIGDFILADHGYRELFWVVSVLGVVALGAALLIPETRPAHAEPPSGLWKAIRLPTLRPLWMAGIVFALSLTSYFVFLKNHAEREALGTISTFFTPYAITAVALRLVAGWIPDRVGPRRMLFPSMILLSVGIAGLGLATSPAHVMAMGVLCGLGHAYTFPILSTLIVERTPEQDRGSALTIFTALFDVGMLLGGPMLGAVVESVSAPFMFFVAAGISLAGLIAFGLWDRPTLSPRTVAPSVPRST